MQCNHTITCAARQLRATARPTAHARGSAFASERSHREQRREQPPVYAAAAAEGAQYAADR